VSNRALSTLQCVVLGGVLGMLGVWPDQWHWWAVILTVAWFNAFKQ
jgi:hypothetical protein